MKDILRQIRTDLRLSMSGAVSSSMRNKGIKYKIIFGVDTPEINRIAQKYSPERTLAETLWGEDVREMKIMATLLYPIDQFSKEVALNWISEIGDQELREQICKNLLQKLPYANDLVIESINNKDESIRATGFWLFARLCIIGSSLVSKIDSELLVNIAVKDLKTKSMLLRQSALNSLKYFGRISQDNSEIVLTKTASLESSLDPIENEMYDQLNFEFGNMG